MTHDHDIIVAPATASGGAIAVVRVSGDRVPELCDRIFRGRERLAGSAGYTVHFGRIVDGARTVDEVLASVFRAPHSYTGEDSVEISCHGSSYIVAEILRLLTDAGARMAEPGEFTVRAYLAGKMDLAQAEAVADLVASSSRAAHALAIDQMRGGYSAALDDLREKLLHLASLLELELDFSEEDVQFADRSELSAIMQRLDEEIGRLRNSFALGNALKQGVAVVIVGAPNVGKSTLLNRLLQDDRALVSDIAGTTRDVIEEQTNIDGVQFRFLDTAGIRSTDDRLEQMGIERTMASIARAQIIVHLVSAETLAAVCTAPESAASACAAHSVPGSADFASSASPGVDFSAPDFPVRDDQTLITVVNKIDLFPSLTLPPLALGISARDGQGVDALGPARPGSVFGISARDGIGVDALRLALRHAVDTEALFHGDTVVSCGRHYAELSEAQNALRQASDGLVSGLPTDLLAEDIHSVIRHLGTITGRGTLTPDDILTNIFSKFCIGK